MTRMEIVVLLIIFQISNFSYIANNIHFAAKILFSILFGVNLVEKTYTFLIFIRH